MESLATDSANLWATAQSGDSQARDELFRLVDRLARRELASRRARTHDIDLLALTTCETVLRYLEGGGTIANNFAQFVKHRSWGVLSDHRKAVRTRRRHETEQRGTDHAVRSAGPLEGLLRAELRRAFQTCVRALPASLRQAFTMYYEQGLETEEVADALHTTARGIYLRLMRARGSLRECLSSKGFDQGDLV
jgi:RNA polymerase sigma factor (sigma-70 family)